MCCFLMFTKHDVSESYLPLAKLDSSVLYVLLALFLQISCAGFTRLKVFILRISLLPQEPDAGVLKVFLRLRQAVLVLQDQMHFTISYRFACQIKPCFKQFTVHRKLLLF